jgi:dienelactone hydrolase
MSRPDPLHRSAAFRRTAALAIAGLALARGSLAAPLPRDLSTRPAGTVTSGIPTLSDPALTWELYLPRGFVPGRRGPVLLLFDPRGRGGVPVELFREAADAFGWMLASSNDTRSDGPAPANARAVNALVSDATQRLPVDEKRIYAGGFSGGAVLAWTMALKAGWLAGVVSVGGRPAPEYAALAPRCPLFAATGDGDFNFLPTLQLDRIAAKAGVSHRLVTFPGPHAWFGKDLARDAVAWLEVLAARDGKAPLPPERLESLRRSEVASARALEETGDVLAAVRRWRETADAFRGLGEVDSLLERAAGLEASPAARAQRKAEEAAEAFEERAGSRIAAAMRLLGDETPSPSPAKLTRTLELEEVLRTAGGEGATAAAARRVLATVHIQLGVYMVQELFRQKEWLRAASALSVAAEAAPRDPAVRYNLACARARSGAATEALAALGEALDRGLSQPLQMETDEDLASLRERPEFAGLLQRARALAAGAKE